MDFGSLNLDNLGNIMSSLTEEDMAKLSSLADELFTSEQKETKKPPQGSVGDLFSGIDPATMSKIAGILARLNSAPTDPRCELITSLKPLLSKDKQQKADEAIKKLQLLSLIPMLGDTM